MTAAPPHPMSATRWMGWGGVAVLLVWMGIASASSPSATEAIEGPVPFFWLALALLVVMGRWAPPQGTTPFARLGGIVLLAWLLESFTAAFTMNWGADPWLIRLIETFHHADHLARFVVIAVAMALLSSVSRRRELWILGPLAVVATVAAVELHVPSAVVVGGVWWAGRVLRGVATRRFTATIALVTVLGTAPESVGVICGWGGSYGSTLFVLFSLPLVDVFSAIAMVQLAVFGAMALRRRRVASARRLWTAAIGCGAIVIGSFVLGGCSDVIMGAGPMLLFLVAGPLSRWSTLVWGTASVLASSVLVAVDWQSVRHGVAGLLLIAAATAAFTLLRRVVGARRIARPS